MKPDGGQRASKIHGTQRGATDRGREVSRNQHSELFVHGRDAQLHEWDSHSHDPAGRARTVQARPNIGACEMTDATNSPRTASALSSFGGRHATV